MSWGDFALARQLLTEEFVGAPIREAQREKTAAEQQAFKETMEELKKGAR